MPPATTVGPTTWEIVPPFEYATTVPAPGSGPNTAPFGAHCPVRPDVTQPGIGEPCGLYGPRESETDKPPAGSVSNEGLRTGTISLQAVPIESNSGKGSKKCLIRRLFTLF